MQTVYISTLMKVLFILKQQFPPKEIWNIDSFRAELSFNTLIVDESFKWSENSHLKRKQQEGPVQSPHLQRFSTSEQRCLPPPNPHPTQCLKIILVSQKACSPKSGQSLHCSVLIATDRVHSCGSTYTVTSQNKIKKNIK